MTTFTSNLLTKLVSHDALHARWLNTLSYLENCGAKFLAACEHPTLVKEEMLKHAAEEFRHAYYLKQQIGKLHTHPLKTYAMNTLLGGYRTIHYLRQLNVQVSSVLKRTYGLDEDAFREAIYVLNSFAIEVRAKALYPTYQEMLKQAGSKVTVRAIIVEEERHLDEMQELINGLSHGADLAAMACQIENRLFDNWVQAVLDDIHIEM